MTKQVDTTKSHVQTTLVKKSSLPTLSEGDFLKYAINFSINPRATFVLGQEADFEKEIEAMKKIKGVRIVKGNVEYTPYVTLSEYFKGDSTVYSGTVQTVFQGNALLLQYFQWHLNSRLGMQNEEVSGEADATTACKIASVLKNENIAEVFMSIFPTFGPADLDLFHNLPFYNEKGEII